MSAAAETLLAAVFYTCIYIYIHDIKGTKTKRQQINSVVRAAVGI